MLFSPLSKLELEIDAILRTKLDKNLFSVKRDDLLRLTRLVVWSERYSVSLDYIIEKLVPHFEKMSQRHYVRRRAGPSKGLGVSIAVLTGQVAEEKLREFIAKDFPDDENIASTREDLKSACLRKLDMSEFSGKPRGVLQHRTVNEYVDNYIAGITRKRRSSAKLERELGRQPWRGNPFR